MRAGVTQLRDHPTRLAPGLCPLAAQETMGALKIQEALVFRGLPDD